MVYSRAQKLADRVEKAHKELVSFIEDCSQEEWEQVIPEEKRTVGVVVNHVASILPDEANMIKTLASGRPVAGIIKVILDEMNARHAERNAGCTQEQTLALLKRNSAETVKLIRSMSDSVLDNAETVSLHWGAPLTAQYIIEEHSLGHTYRHLAGIRAVFDKEA